MSDKDIKKAHIEEIEIEILEEDYIVENTLKENRVKRNYKKKKRKKKNLFNDIILNLKEYGEVGIEAIRKYKDRLISQKEERKTVKPNSALLTAKKSLEEIESSNEISFEIEYAKDEKLFKDNNPADVKRYAEKRHVTSDDDSVVEKTKYSKRKVNKFKNRPSRSASAIAQNFIEILKNKDGKKSIVSDKDFIKFIGIITLLILLFGAVWFGFSGLKVNNTKTNTVISDVEYPGPIKPNKLFTSRTPEIRNLLGAPISSGSIDGTTDKFLDYNLSWFGEDTISKIIYGEDKRITKVDISFKESSLEKVFLNVKKYLGEPFANNQETKEIVWFQDSAMYSLKEVDGKAALNIELPVYNNFNNYPIREGSIIIEKQGAHDLTGDGKNDVLVLIGEKESYIYSEFTKLHMTIWDGENVFFTSFPTDSDGGTNIKLTYNDIDKDGIKDISVESKSEVMSNYNSFTVKNSAISNIYTSHDKPK
ncbi:MAG: hypothetical protein ACRDA4_04595 [Filifactoraceae bacterium]